MTGEVPDCDPLDGGINAQALFLFEKPGPMTAADGSGRRAGSRYISRNNDDPTAEAAFNFMRRAGIPHSLTVTWNVVPNWNGARKIRGPEPNDGVALMRQLIELLLGLRAIVLFGKKAARAERHLAAGKLAIFTSAHPSPLVIASPGGVCLSSRVHDDVRDRLNAEFEEGGEQRLKNIARPVRVWHWSPTGATSLARIAAVAGAPVSLPDRPSIAVLPFTNMSGDPEQEFFTDGVSEDVITELSRFRSLFVIARSSSFTYKGKSVDVRTVAKELGVRYVLEGSIRKAGERIRVTGQLIDALA